MHGCRWGGVLVGLMAAGISHVFRLDMLACLIAGALCVSVIGWLRRDRVELSAVRALGAV